MTSVRQGTSAGNALHAALEYRPDIDGLRAIAVLSVVLYHAFPAAMPGGFAGVDVFFVISGFLISSILIKDLHLGRFSIRGFYARRIARIFPALLTVLAASLAFGWLALLADEYARLGKHVLGGAGFVANLVFWSESSYFDVAAETKPLLHLWSLGVEEQFYLLWPLALWAIWKKKANLPCVVAGMAAVSFSLNIHAAAHYPAVDFYWPHTRFWELLAGALIAALPARPQPSSHTRAPSMESCIGVALLAVSFLLIDSSKVFPGWLALLPVTGTALLIHAGPAAFANRALSHPMLVGVGLISYPLYLWHWPLLAFARIVEGTALPTTTSCMAVLLALLLAWATYRFVETPVRRSATARPAVAIILAGSMAAVATAAAVVVANGGFSDRSGARPVEKYSNDIGKDPYLTYLSRHMYRCTNTRLLELSGNDNVYGHRCFQSQPSGPIDLLIFGDSHAEHLLPGFADVFEGRNVASFLQYGMPSIESERFTEALRLAAHDPDIRTIVVSAYWASKIQPGGTPYEQQLRKTFELLAATRKTIYVLGDIPTFAFTPDKCKYARRFASGKSTCASSLQEHSKWRDYYFEVLAAALKDLDNVRFIATDQFFCDQTRCDMTRDGMLLYRDNHHLNVDGSKYVVRMLTERAGLIAP